MKVDWLDIINIIMIFQLLIFAVFLFIKSTNHTSNYILGIHIFAQAAGIFTGLASLQTEFFFNDHPHLALIGFPYVFLWGPSFYLYVKSIAYKDFKLKWIDLLHALPAFLLLLFFSFTFYFHAAGAKRIILDDPSYPFFSNRILIDLILRTQVLVYIIKSFYILFEVRKKLKEDYSSISKMNFSWLVFVVSGYTICYIISVSFIYAEFYLKNFSRVLLLGNFFQYFIYFNIIFFKAWSRPEIFRKIEENVKYKYSGLTKETAHGWIKKLEEYTSVNKPYLNPEITITQLAENIDIHPRLLSQIINEYFGLNFFDYTNRLRIEESKKMLLDNSSGKNVLEILYDSGFNSKATFHRAFKKETGLSPTEYRKKNLTQ